MPKAVSFKEVLEKEIEEIATSREARRAKVRDADERVGLAFSGGGIRSATFNLGVLQALASRPGFLQRIDYLSTVSGGGYIGSWLTAFIRRTNLAHVEKAIRQGGGQDETPEISFLRTYSNYLTPKIGLFSLDTLTSVSIYLRNTLLNLAVLCFGFSVLLLLPRFVRSLIDLHGLELFSSRLLVFLASASAAAVFFASHVASHVAPGDLPILKRWGGRLVEASNAVLKRLGLGRFAAKPCEPAEPIDDERDYAFMGRPFWVHLTVAIPACVSSGWLFFAAVDGGTAASGREGTSGYLVLTLFVVASLLSIYQAGRARVTAATFWRPISLTGALALGLLLKAWLAPLVLIWAGSDDERIEKILTVGAGAAIAIVLVAGVLFVGLYGRSYTTAKREWWGRLGGLLMLYGFGWVALCAISFWSDEFFLSNQYWDVYLASAWILTTTIGIGAGQMLPANGSASRNGLKYALGKVALASPFIFGLGLVSQLAHRLEQVEPHALEFFQRTFADARLDFLANTEPRQYAWMIVALFVIGGFLSWRFDLNEFSMHGYYRNRLVRAYLGASNQQRIPHPFTGFDEADLALRLNDLSTGKTVVEGAYELPVERDERRARAKIVETVRDEVDYDGPLHLINTTLNLAGGKNLAWQQRKGASFVFSPLYTGFDVDYTSEKTKSGAKWYSVELDDCAYRPTAGYEDGISLGGAMAVSGAAASPNMGNRTGSALAFMLTVFNVRLGAWLGNPRVRRGPFLTGREPWRKSGPLLGVVYLVFELLAMTSDDIAYVYLSDGGHFDNLGVYELVKRRCRYIIVSDAEADPKLSFNSLGALIRKCRADLDVTITIDVTPIRSRQEGLSGTCFVRGEIVYKDHPPGELLYLKASLIDGLPTDVDTFSRKMPGFPHHSTADQWFTEEQFESYRVLGRRLADQAFSNHDSIEACFPGPATTQVGGPGEAALVAAASAQARTGRPTGRLA